MAQNKSYRELLELQGQTGGNQQSGGTQTSNQMLELILNRQPFQYDQKTDPAAQAARKTAALNARAVTQNTLGQHAAMTGGMPSTAAVSAAAQAGNAALQQGADKVAELQELAYQRYRNEGQDMYNAYAALQQQEADAYNRERDAIADQRYQQEWEYQQGRDQIADRRYQDEQAYGRERDALADQRYQDELAYGRKWDEEQREYSRGQTEYERKYQLALLMAQYGDYSGLKELGVDTSKFAAGGGYGGGDYYTPRNPQNPQDDGKDPESGIPAGVKNDLKYQYGSNLPEDVYEQMKAQYGEDALIAAGFTKKVEQKKPSGGGAGAGTGNKRPGAGNNRQDMMI